jgi:dTDP-4-dehydrorhamnose 3,5-epimerase
MLSIQDILITPLKIKEDERGAVMHMLRSDAPHFEQFGEVYFSLTRPSIIKAWKRHQRMTLNVAVPVGSIRLVVYDDREVSSTFNMFDEFLLGPKDQYALITIPPMVWTGFQNVGVESALLANCASIPHDPGEVEQRPANDPSIPFTW